VVVLAVACVVSSDGQKKKMIQLSSETFAWMVIPADMAVAVVVEAVVISSS
jgi:hypothetical protein